MCRRIQRSIRPLSSSKLTAVPVHPLSSGFATSPVMTAAAKQRCLLFFVGLSLARVLSVEALAPHDLKNAHFSSASTRTAEKGRTMVAGRGEDARTTTGHAH
jgi:hypothetical protein